MASCRVFVVGLAIALAVPIGRPTRVVAAGADAAVPVGAGQVSGAHPFRVEEVRFPGVDVQLAGTLYLPAAEGRHPAVVMLHGSGEMDRTSPYYREHASWFAGLGLAVLDFDRRGVGGSGGHVEENPDLLGSAGDASAALRYLRARAEVDPAKLGVFGISQGGWVGQIVGAQDSAVAFIVLVSAPAVSPLEQKLYERGIEMVESGFSPEEAAAVVPLRRMLWNFYHTGEGRAALESAWAASRGEPWFTKLGWPEEPPLREALNESQRSFYGAHCGYEPAPFLARLRAPALFLFGAKDRHVPVERSVEITRETTADNPRVRVVVFPDAGHLLQAVDGAAESLGEVANAHATSGGGMPAPIPAARDSILAWLATGASVLP